MPRTIFSAAQHRRLFDRSSVSMAMVSMHGQPHFVAASRGFLESLALQRGRVVGRLLTDVLSPAGGEMLADAIGRCLATSLPVRTEFKRGGASAERTVTLAVHDVRARGFSEHVLVMVDGAADGWRDAGPDDSATSTLSKASEQPAEGDERARIGRELHDSTLQYLVAAELGLARVLSGDAIPADARERLLDVQTSLTIVQTEIRALAFVLHPPELSEFGLLTALGKFCAGFARRSGLEIEFTADDLPSELSKEAQQALFRVCQESLMNVHRHAYARKVAVRLEVDAVKVAMEVRDDGVRTDSTERAEQGGVGIAAMRWRMENVGGQLRLDGLRGGLAVIATIPARAWSSAPSKH